LYACRESYFSAYLTLWFPLLIWWTPLCRMLQIMTRRFTLYAYGKSTEQQGGKKRAGGKLLREAGNRFTVDSHEPSSKGFSLCVRC
ncbi:hypothetical protein ACSFCW_27235, partial [Yokenella regensburgei]|uniref:hypothetical protein n=1 Tax=Yokenella regensburgei TaxID=158877 RepID=UPI003EDA7AC6